MIVPRTDVLAAKDELWRQVTAGGLTAAEYAVAFEQLNAAHSHDRRCANGDWRPVIVTIDGRDLCGLCWQKHHEAHA